MAMGPPRIMFDDGSRIMHDDDDGLHHDTIAPSSSSLAEKSPSTRSSARGAAPLRTYYEIDRVAREVVEKLDWSASTPRGRLLNRILDAVAAPDDDGDDDDDGFLCRVALQFPDELLRDAPEVSWLMEGAIAGTYGEKLASSTAGNAPDREETMTALTERHLARRTPLIFVLGDTTYGSCCPDEVSANHLEADVVVHYGHSCLAPTESVPVVYAFGVSAVGGGGADGSDDTVWKEYMRLAAKEAAGGEGQREVVDVGGEEGYNKMLILYEVKYHHAMEEFKSEFEETGQFQVIVGAIPKQQLRVGRRGMPKGKGGGCGSGSSGDDCGEGGGCGSGAMAVTPPADSGYCESKNGAQQSNQSCAKESPSACVETGEPQYIPIDKDATPGERGTEKQYIPRTMGGLEIPNDLDLSQHTLLYVGDDFNIDSHDGNAPTRLLHILLRCGAADGPRSLWSYSPAHRRLNKDLLDSPLSPTDSTTLSAALSRTLRRRYFLINKAKLATTIAVLIGTTSQSNGFRCLLSRTRQRIQSTGRTAYTFAVGKLSSSPSKLANFAEIDAFVLIACGESVAKFWRMEREEMLVPVLTPLELDVALGYREWDGRYSCEFGDLLRWDEEDGLATNEDSLDCDADIRVGSNDDNDEPFFSVISGKYEQSRMVAASNLQALPGQGKLIEYKSEAAEFLKRREYRGLEADVGGTKAKAAVSGQVGIASNYGEAL